jgi:hypothetical protein
VDVQMMNRRSMRENIMGNDYSTPEILSGTVYSRISGSFMSAAHTALHRITLLIGLVVILLVAAGF